MSSNFFFKKKSLKLNQVFPDNKKIENFIINEVKPLHLAKKMILLFLTQLNTSLMQQILKVLYA